MTTTKTREELLEAALRIALRKLDGRLYTLDNEELEARPKEGAVVVGFDQHGHFEASISGILTRDECLAILNAIDEGEDPIVGGDRFKDVFAGNVRYETKAGHVVEVFNDCDCWDYVDSITHADGRHWEYADVCSMPYDGTDPGHWSPENPKRWGAK